MCFRNFRVGKRSLWLPVDMTWEWRNFLRAAHEAIGFEVWRVLK